MIMSRLYYRSSLRLFPTSPKPSRLLSFYSTSTPDCHKLEPNPKLDPIVQSISDLTLIEIADLISLLKTRLNISEIAAPLPATPVAAAAAAPAASQEEEAVEKTQFTVKLEKIDPSLKAKVIKEIRSLIPNMNLVEAKKFVESAPQIVKKDVSKADAEKIKKTLEAVGATVAME